jgi:hypothetical protein
MSPGLVVRNPLTMTIPVATGAAATFAFYAHALLGMPPRSVTPLITALVAGGLVLMALLGFLSMRLVSVPEAMRKASAAMLYLAVALCSVSTISGAFERQMDLLDLGLFVVQVGTPVLLFLCFDRIGLLRALCRISVLFALADLTVNLLTLFHIADIARVDGAGSGYGAHYTGLPGNSFAEGIVAFVALSYIAAGVPFSRTWERGIRLLLIVALFGSEYLIRARTDIGISIVAVALLMFRSLRRVPAVLVAVLISGTLLFAIFHSAPGNNEERLRTDMMATGFAEAKTHVVVGTGVRYRATQDLVATFHSLRQGGITESGALDFATAYGCLATACLYLSALLALLAPRLRQTLPAVILACLTGAMASTGAFGNFFDSILFYGTLIVCQRDEWWAVQNTPRAI